MIVYLFVCGASQSMRCLNSNLKGDFFQRALSQNNLCDSCGVIEDANHFLLQCRQYNRLRADVVTIISLKCFNMLAIMNGSDRYTQELNIFIQKAVQIFIIGSNGFS